METIARLMLGVRSYVEMASGDFRVLGEFPIAVRQFK
jgi:hypothetical protein